MDEEEEEQKNKKPVRRRPVSHIPVLEIYAKCRTDELQR